MNLWNQFAEKHPSAAQWVREGGLFVIISNLITVLKYLLLQFLPAACGLGNTAFGWPGIPVTLFGETFQWNILGYDRPMGALPISAPTWWPWSLARSSTFLSSATLCSAPKESWVPRSPGICWRFLSLPASSTPSTVCGWRWPGCWCRTLSTTSAPVLNGGISMIVFFFVNKKIFRRRSPDKDRTAA